MTELTPCEFFLFRYVPDVVRGEFINFGVLIRQNASPRSLVRFTRDWSRVQAAGADVVFLEEFEADIVGRLRDESVDAVLEEFLDSLSNSIQIDGPHAAIALTLEAEMDRLMRLYVEPHSTDNAIGPV